MTLEVIESGSPPRGRDLSQAIVELQNLTFSVVAGAAADANIALTGLSYANDTIKSVLRFDVAVDTGTSATGNKVQSVTDLTAEVQAGSTDATFQLGTTDTSGDTLLVIWYNKGAL